MANAPTCFFSLPGIALPKNNRGKEARMAKAKAEALELIMQLPDDVTTGRIMEELFFKQQVEKGLQDAAEGRILTHQELKERIARWRKSAGR
jgi:transposase